MPGLRLSGITLLATALIGVGGCSFFPQDGPASVDVLSQKSDIVPYGLVKLTPETVDILAAYEPKGLAGTFTDRRPASNIKFGVGDIVSTTVFEATAGGLFIPLDAGARPGNFVTLPDQAVDDHGNISFPFAGVIRAAGRNNVEIQNEIVERIKNRAIEPQVIITLAQQRTSLISVIGEVNTPLRFAVPATGAGDRILDAITRAGGIKGQGFSTWVMLERGGKRATVPFENLVMNASNNIYIQPGDRIYVYQEQQKFIAFGATGALDAIGSQGEFNFDAWRINLAEAVAKAGGLQDARADASAVFLYRREPREVAKLLGVDTGRFAGDLVPVIFQVNLRDPGGYFIATRTQMRNGDVIYVSNAQSNDLSKFFNFVNTVASASAVTTTAIVGVPTASAAIHGHALAGAAVVQ
ncbi:polysaccharide export protein [Methylocella silvestris BL2]|uniref:Polysaccharide export protein n=1 Tax=Methylocella silvestris (strain DSM 15510 / CIP 108128 / LMG 27833 / NCIMB 13906 / BL2) TaxID=395965 RepID=B8EL80_METSB|nr:polysaccharide biosynthesis/export family protein [Methylocella silvestris]ACK49075.1 polysaccharide export protein [Methylocella silvestris BL2]